MRFLMKKDALQRHILCFYLPKIATIAPTTIPRVMERVMRITRILVILLLTRLYPCVLFSNGVLGFLSTISFFRFALTVAFFVLANVFTSVKK